MAKKSFKKGVKNVIDSIEKDSKRAAAEKPKTNTGEAKQPAAGQKSKPETKKNDVEFNLGSRFIVHEVDSAMSKFKKALTHKDEVTIISDEVTEIDLSYIQMILSFEKAAKNKGLTVHWKLVMSDDIMQSVQQSGMWDVLKPFLDESIAEVVGNG